MYMQSGPDLFTFVLMGVVTVVAFTFAVIASFSKPEKLGIPAFTNLAVGLIFLVLWGADIYDSKRFGGLPLTPYHGYQLVYVAILLLGGARCIYWYRRNTEPVNRP